MHTSSSAWHVSGAEEIHLTQVWAMCPGEMGRMNRVWVGIKKTEGFEGQLVSLNFIQGLLERHRKLAGKEASGSELSLRIILDR